MILSVESQINANVQSDDISEVAICCDTVGLEFLISKLKTLRNKSDHLHFMTATWGGKELTNKKQGTDDYILVNHLRIVRLPDKND